MRKLYVTLVMLVALLFTAQQTQAQNNVGIGTPTPNASAKLDVSSTTQGILVPRMTQANRNAIATPATGLMIFQTDNTPGFYYNAGTPAAANWQAVGGSASNGPTLLVRASANIAQVIPVGSNTAAPTLATCFGNISTNVGGAYNATTGVFTAPTEGLYMVTIQTISALNGSVILPYLDVNNDYTDNSQNTNAVIGPDFLGVQSINTASIQAAINNRGQLSAQVFLTAGQVFSIRFNQSSTAGQPTPRTDGSTNFTVVKLL